MALQIFVETRLTTHCVAALATVTRMRTTNAEICAIIERTRTILEGGRKAMLEAEVLVRAGGVHLPLFAASARA